MSDNNIIDIFDLLDQKINNRKLSQEFFLAVSELFFDLDIKGQQFVDDFIFSFIKHVESQVDRKGDIKLSTGFTPTIIQRVLENRPVSQSNSDNTFYTDLVIKIQSACQKSKDGSIPIIGPKSYSKIFYSFDNRPKMVSSQGMLDSLIKKGIVQKSGKKKISFIQSIPSSHDNSPEHITMLFNNVVRRFSKTLRNNFLANSDSNKLPQMSYYSRHIPVEKFESTNAELKLEVRKFLNACQEIIDRNEVQTEFEKKQIEKLGLEFGVSVFVFNINPNEE